MNRPDMLRAVADWPNTALLSDETRALRDAAPALIAIADAAGELRALRDREFTGAELDAALDAIVAAHERLVALKTWRQIDAMAKQRGALVDRGLHSASIYRLLGRETDALLFRFESWLTPRSNSIVLRAACEAALERLVT